MIATKSASIIPTFTPDPFEDLLIWLGRLLHHVELCGAEPKLGRDFSFIGDGEFPHDDVAASIRTRVSHAEPGNPDARTDVVEITSDEYVTVLLTPGQFGMPSVDDEIVHVRGYDVDALPWSLVRTKYNGKPALLVTYRLEA